ncbi:MAG TPA: DUF2950 family protein [Planctomycetota bacterium]|nr:DUF2950 family protein [Planctomycetota bacterium]
MSARPGISSFTVACAALLLFCCQMTAAERTRAEELFPEKTLVAFVLPDLQEARLSASGTWLAAMYAQPEMKDFLQPALAQMKDTYARMRALNALLPALEDLDLGLLSGEIAGCIYSRPGDTRQPLGAFVTLHPKDIEAFKRLLPENVRPVLVENMMLPLGENAESAAIAYLNGRVLLCWPQKDIGQFMGKTRDATLRVKNTLLTNQGFVGVRNKVGNCNAWFYCMPQAMLGVVMEQTRATPQQREQYEAVLKALGLNVVSSFGMGVNLNGRDPALDAYAAFDRAPEKGLFSLLISNTPITAAGMRIAPPDAPYVAAGQFKFNGVIPLLEDLLAAVLPEARESFPEVRTVASQVLQFDMQTDLLENLGHEIVVVQTPFDTAAPLSVLPGMVASIPAKNPARIADCLRKLAEALERTNGEMFARLKLRKLEHRGKQLWYIGGNVLASPLAFAVAGDRLLVGTSLNAVRRGIEQLDKNENILENKEFQETLSRLSARAFDANALPSSFAFAADRGSGNGTLALTALALCAGTGVLGAVAEIPPLGAQDIIANEIGALKLCLGFVEAQEAYKKKDYDKDGVLEYAQSLRGDNSLLETKSGEADLLLIDRDFAAAEGQPLVKVGKSGYRFRVLKGQGPDAPGGALTYLDQGNLKNGFALVAYPAEYNISGRRTILINHLGKAYARDLGPETHDLIRKMDVFNPNQGWLALEVGFDEKGNLVENSPQTVANSLAKFLAKPSGKAVVGVLEKVDLNLWPDEGFFARYRHPTGAITSLSPEGAWTKIELPPPGPSTMGGVSPLMIFAGSSIIAAIAVPTLVPVPDKSEKPEAPKPPEKQELK